MGQHPWAGHLCSALLQDTCKHLEAPKSKAMGALDGFKKPSLPATSHHSSGVAPPAPGPQRDVLGYIPRGSLRDTGTVTLLPASLFSSLCSIPAALQGHSVLSQPPAPHTQHRHYF